LARLRASTSDTASLGGDSIGGTIVVSQAAPEFAKAGQVLSKIAADVVAEPGGW
jgi:hypothetical protein